MHSLPSLTEPDRRRDGDRFSGNKFKREGQKVERHRQTGMERDRNRETYGQRERDRDRRLKLDIQTETGK